MSYTNSTKQDLNKYVASYRKAVKIETKSKIMTNADLNLSTEHFKVFKEKVSK